MSSKKDIKFESVYGFAVTGARKEGDMASVGFQFNVNDSFPTESKLSMAQNTLDEYVYPEIMKRVKDGTLDPTFRVVFAQVLMYSDNSKNEVLLNDEVRLILNVVFKNSKTFKPNERVNFLDVDGILGIYPSVKNHPNAAHLMLVKFNSKWHFAADIIYNRQIVKEKYRASQDYMKVVSQAFKDQNWIPFVDNLFTITELAIQSIMELHYHNKHSHTQTHPMTKKLFRTFCQNGNAPMTFIENYEKLEQERKKARYHRGTHGKKYSIDIEVAQNYLTTTNEILKYTEKLLRSIDYNSKPKNGEYLAIGSK